MLGPNFIPETNKGTILIVDDDPDTCQVLALLLQSRGYQSQPANSGEQGIECLKSASYDLVLLDIMMPGMDGWETYRHIRSYTRDTPVLFLTALQTGENAVKALNLGAQDYIRKPFHHTELMERIGKSIANARRLAELAAAPLKHPTVSLILPTLNEARNLPLVLPYLPLEWIDEVLLVDGRSTDKTIEVAQKLLPSIKIVKEPRRGKGIAMRAGYRASSGEIIIVMDADGSNDPREIPRYIKALMEGADFVKGSRFTPGGGTTDMTRFRQMGNRFFVMLVNLLFNVHFSDLCYGYHAFWRFCLDTVKLDDIDGFEIDTAIYIRSLRERLKIVEVPSFEGYRFYGLGKLRAIPDGMRVLGIILRETFSSVKTPARNLYKGFRGGSPAPAIPAFQGARISSKLHRE